MSTTAWIVPQEGILTPRARRISVTFKSKLSALAPLLIQSSSSVAKVPRAQKARERKVCNAVKRDRRVATLKRYIL